ncbi:hypothetical protein LXL04_002887 [Taraxacum kok-saghyz]
MIKSSRLSEDLTGCISSIYCKLVDQKKWTYFFCYVFVFLGYILYSDTWSSYYTEGASWDSKNEGLKEEKGPYGNMIEVLKIGVDDDGFHYAA